MLASAKLAAKQAGKILFDYFKTEIEIRQKGEDDLVTDVDFIAEKKIMSTLKRIYPTHSFYGEESGTDKRKSQYMWVIDALDGTINFTRDLNPFCVSIGLLKNGQPHIGVVFDPIHNEMFFAQKGKGAYLNGKKIHVSGRQELASSILVADLTTKKDFHEHFFDVMKKISKSVLGIRITHCTSLNLARLAVGRFDIYIKNRFEFKELVAGACIIREAGGRLTDFNNRRISRNMKSLIASNTVLHKGVLRLIK
ncbi:MAG: inositol monophosphatase family protein [archaeon]